MLAASFFFNRQDNNRCDTNRVVATIAYQLAISIPALKRTICDVIELDRTILTRRLEVQLEKLIIEPMRSLPQKDYSWIITIDALDECQDIDQMARLITRVINLPIHLRFFITSRHEPRIPAEIRRAGLSYDLQDFQPDEDICLFLTRSLQSVRQARSHVMSHIPSLWPSGDALNILVKKSSGLFIYASTVARFIGDEYRIPHRQLEMVLENSSSPGLTELDQLYMQVLSSSTPGNAEFVRSVVGAIVLLRNPLSPQALAYLLRIEIDDLQLLFEKLHSILLIPDLSIPVNFVTGLVTTIHLSLYDFITCEDRSGPYFVDPSSKDADLAKYCLDRIATLPRLTFLTSRDPYQCRSAVAEYMECCDRAHKSATRYACYYWSSHLCEASPSRKDLMGDMKKFSCHFLFPWCMFMQIDTQFNVPEEDVQSPETDMAKKRKRVWEIVWEKERVREMARAQTRGWMVVIGSVTVLLLLGMYPMTVFGDRLGLQLGWKWKARFALAFSMGFAFECGVCALMVSFSGLTMNIMRSAQSAQQKYMMQDNVEICILQAKPWINVISGFMQ